MDENNKEKVNEIPQDNLEQIVEEAKKKLENGEEKIETETKIEGQEQIQEQPVGIELLELEVDALKQLYSNLFKVIATRAGEHWEINDAESEMLAKPTKAVLDKYAIKMTPEFSLVVSVIVVVAPRLVLSLTKPKKEQKNE